MGNPAESTRALSRILGELRLGRGEASRRITLLRQALVLQLASPLRFFKICNSCPIWAYFPL